MAFVNAPQLAAAMHVSEHRIRQLSVEGMPKAMRGRYDLVPCLEWYIRFLQRHSLTGRASNDAVCKNRARLLIAQSERAERINKIEAAEVVPIEAMRARVSTMIVTARQNLLNLPARVAPQLEGEPRLVIKEKLRLEISRRLPHWRSTAMATG